MKLNKLKINLAMIEAHVDDSKSLAAAAGISVNTVSRILNGSEANLPTVR